MGESPYAIALSLCQYLASLLHLKGWTATAGEVVAALARSIGLMEALPPRPAPTHPGEALALASSWPSWPAFTHAFSRVLYPKRFPLRRTHTISL